jgi:hypothetical protein
VWNWEITTFLAKEVKRINPKCLIIFGGPEVPDLTDDFFKKHPFVDLIVHGEGEYILANIFEEFLNKFLRKFGLRKPTTPECSSLDFNNDKELFERLMAALKNNTRPTLYSILTKVVLGAYRDDSKVVVVCEDRMTVDFLRKKFLHILERAASGPVELICKQDISARRNIE